MKYWMSIGVVIIICFTFSCDMLTNTESPDYFSFWYTEVSPDGMGSVMLSVSGTTKADSISVMTFGDGEVYEYFLELEEGRFEEQVCVLLINDSQGVEPAEYSTELRFYTGESVEVIYLNSPVLSF